MSPRWMNGERGLGIFPPSPSLKTGIGRVCWRWVDLWNKYTENIIWIFISNHLMVNTLKVFMFLDKLSLRMWNKKVHGIFITINIYYLFSKRCYYLKVFKVEELHRILDTHLNNVKNGSQVWTFESTMDIK